MNDPIPRPDQGQWPWLKTPALEKILSRISAGGGEARIVGGAVRDTLLGKSPTEIDLAVNLPPDQTSALLGAAGLKVVPTGIEHGTITAVIDHKGYEITSLRRDVETDGRRAKVAFTDDWKADAARRDFTFNALYVDAEGRLYDYFDGRRDLLDGHVRFIGEARQRIEEDVLRILRYFRFYAWFGRGAPNKEALTACQDLASLIPRLSVERVWRELIKLLSAEKPLPAWTLLRTTGVLMHILPEATNLARLEALTKVETDYDLASAPLLRLAALLPPGENKASALALRLKLSGREAAELRALATLPGILRGKLDPVPLRRLIYEHGEDHCRKASCLLAADEAGTRLEAVLEIIAAWENPSFPLAGGDLLKLGVSPGPELGKILGGIESWWEMRDFRPTRDECLAELRRVMQGEKS